MDRQKISSTSPMLVVMLVALTLVGCASPLIKKPLSKDLHGNLNIQKVHVEKLAGINSARIVGVVRQAMVEKTRAELNSGKNTEMHILIEKYRGPETQIGGSALARFAGSKSTIQALIKVIDPADGGVLAEYRAVAEYKMGGMLSGEVSFHDSYEGLMWKFTHFAIDPIS